MSTRDANACHNHPRNHPLRVMQVAWWRFILRAADVPVEERIHHTMPISQKWLRRCSRSAPMWRPCSSTGFPRAPPGMVACQFHKSVAPFFYKSHGSRAQSERIYRS
jgi:hypothetical protein